MQAGRDCISPREGRIYMKGGQWRQQEWKDLVRVLKVCQLTSFSDVAGLCRIEDAFCKLQDNHDQSHHSICGGVAYAAYAAAWHKPYMPQCSIYGICSSTD